MRARVLVPAAVAACLLPAAPAFAGDPIMRLSDVRSGMQCTGYSVVRGTDIASFGVEVLDVVAGDPSEDGARILIEASGPAVDRTGIGPGFSGSPIYCPDAQGTQRNIGAISESIGEYGGKVVLATPIEAILSNPVEAPRARATSARARTAVRRLRRVGTRPLLGPLTVSGLSGPLNRAMQAGARRAGRTVLATPAGPLGTFPVQTLRPGSSVSAGYSTGDLRVGAVGTVAYTDGPGVWAFGHPFENAGERALLLQDAYVFRVIADPHTGLDGGGSYKLAAPGHDLGAVTNDALTAVTGRVGRLPSTVPVTATARDADTGATRRVETRVADEVDAGSPTGISPLTSIAPLAVAQAAGSVLGSGPARLTGTSCFRVTLRERPATPVGFCNRETSGGIGDFEDGGFGNPIASTAASDLFEVLSILDAYEGRPAHVAGIEVETTIARGEHRASIVRAKVPRRVRPGQVIPVKVRLQKIRGGRETRTYSMRIPRRARPGVRTLVLRGVQRSDGLEELFELLFGDFDGGPQSGPQTVDELLALMQSVRRWDGVEMRVGNRRRRAFRDPGLVIEGRDRARVRVVKVKRARRR